LAAATPREMKDENGYILTWEEHIRHEVHNAIEGIQEATITRYQAGLIEGADELTTD